MSYLPKPEGCAGCVLATSGKGFCPDQVVPNALYTIYGEAPGSTEIEEGKPFQGKAGFVLKEWLMKAVPLLRLASEKRKVSYKNVLKCLPPIKHGRPYPTGETRTLAEAHCAQYRDDSTDAPVVVLCGDISQRAFFSAELEAEDAADKSLGHELKGVIGRIGRTYIKNGRKYVFCIHPAAILRQPALVSHGQSALNIATGVDKVLEPDYISWGTAIAELLKM